MSTGDTNTDPEQEGPEGRDEMLAQVARIRELLEQAFPLSGPDSEIESPAPDIENAVVAGERAGQEWAETRATDAEIARLEWLERQPLHLLESLDATAFVFAVVPQNAHDPGSANRYWRTALEQLASLRDVHYDPDNPSFQHGFFYGATQAARRALQGQEIPAFDEPDADLSDNSDSDRGRAIGREWASTRADHAELQRFVQFGEFSGLDGITGTLSGTDEQYIARLMFLLSPQPLVSILGYREVWQRMLGVRVANPWNRHLAEEFVQGALEVAPARLSHLESDEPLGSTENRNLRRVVVRDRPPDDTANGRP